MSTCSFVPLIFNGTCHVSVMWLSKKNQILILTLYGISFILVLSLHYKVSIFHFGPILPSLSPPTHFFSPLCHHRLEAMRRQSLWLCWVRRGYIVDSRIVLILGVHNMNDKVTEVLMLCLLAREFHFSIKVICNTWVLVTGPILKMKRFGKF